MQGVDGEIGGDSFHSRFGALNQDQYGKSWGRVFIIICRLGKEAQVMQKCIVYWVSQLQMKDARKRRIDDANGSAVWAVPGSGIKDVAWRYISTPGTIPSGCKERGTAGGWWWASGEHGILNWWLPGKREGCLLGTVRDWRGRQEWAIVGSMTLRSICKSAWLRPMMCRE